MRESIGVSMKSRSNVFEFGLAWIDLTDTCSSWPYRISTVFSLTHCIVLTDFVHN